MRVEVIKGLVSHNDKDYIVGKSFTCNKADGQHLIDAGFVKEVEEKKNSKSSNSSATKKDATADADLIKLTELQTVAKELDGKDTEVLTAEIDLANELDLKEGE